MTYEYTEDFLNLIVVFANTSYFLFCICFNFIEKYEPEHKCSDT